MPSILCSGLIAVDLVFAVSAFPVKGSKHRAETCRMTTGGGALNAASAIVSLGGGASLSGAIGDDAFGRFIRQSMADRGIDDRLVQTVPGATTSRSANILTPDGDRTIVNHRDPALLSMPFELPTGLSFDAALVDTRWPAAAVRIVRAAKRNGKPAVVDAEAPVADAKPALESASHVVFSEQGLADFCGGTGPDALRRAVARIGCWVAVTRGGRPVLCCDGGDVTEIPTHSTHAVNTLGAGDVWHGAFALALAQGRSEIDAARWANAAASLKVRRPLGCEDLPTAAEVEALMAMPRLNGETGNGN